MVRIYILSHDSIQFFPVKVFLKSAITILQTKGLIRIKDIFSCQPLEAVTQQFFSLPELSLEDLKELFRPKHEHILENDSNFIERHQQFTKFTLPKALENICKHKPTFLSDFVFFVTGSRCIPYLAGNSDFEIQVLFETTATENALPQSHTCDNMIHIPWGAYGNDVNTFSKIIEKAVEYALKAGFDMA